MAGQTENDWARLVHGGLTGHEGFTHMLFVDAIVGLGITKLSVGLAAELSELADFIGRLYNEEWAWRRPAIEALPLVEVQGLYLALKQDEVTHAQ